MNIFLIGPMAAGKSHIGKTLAKRLKHCFYDTDDLVCQRAGMDIPTIFNKAGEANFRKQEAEVLRGLAGKHDIVVATGGGIVLDQQNCKYIKENGTVVYLNTALDIRYRRMQTPAGRPLLTAGNAYQVMQDVDRERRPIYEALADFIVENNHDVAATTTEIIECIEKAKEI